MFLSIFCSIYHYLEFQPRLPKQSTFTSSTFNLGWESSLVLSPEWKQRDGKEFDFEETCVGVWEGAVFGGPCEVLFRLYPVFRFRIQMADLMLEIQREAQLRAEARAGARAPGNDAEVKRQVIAQVDVAANLRLQLLLTGVELACEGARHLRAQV